MEACSHQAINSVTAVMDWHWLVDSYHHSCSYFSGWWLNRCCWKNIFTRPLKHGQVASWKDLLSFLLSLFCSFIAHQLLDNPNDCHCGMVLACGCLLLLRQLLLPLSISQVPLKCVFLQAFKHGWVAVWKDLALVFFQSFSRCPQHASWPSNHCCRIPETNKTSTS